MVEDETIFSLDRLAQINNDCLQALEGLVYFNASRVEMMAAARIVRVMQHLDMLDEHVMKYIDPLCGDNKDRINFISLVDEELDRTPRKPTLVK